MNFWFLLFSVLGGFGCNMIAKKSRGKNGRNALRYAAWGFWLAPLTFLSFLLPFPLSLPILSTILMLTPAAICFWMAAASMLKEMRAQKVGAYTERA